MDIRQCRLTIEEITMVLEAVPEPGVSAVGAAWGDEDNRAIADAATEKALRCVLLWLQGFEVSHRHIHGYYSDFPGISRSHGLRMAAEELEALLAVKPSL